MAPQQRPKQTGVTKGPVSAVPCPWCGKMNDCREYYATNQLEPEATLECDHCQNMFDVVKVQPIVVVVVKQSPRNQELRSKRVARRGG